MSLPLSGRTVVIARSAEKAAPLAKILEELGAKAIALPATRHVLVREEGAGARLARSIEAATHAVFTSPTAVQLALELLSRAGENAAPLGRLRIAAVGPATAAALEERGLAPVLVAGVGGGEELARRLLAEEKLGPAHRVVLPQSAIARPELGQKLRECGVHVDAISVYETVAEGPESSKKLIGALSDAPPPDAIVFASPSALEALLETSREAGRTALEGSSIHIVTIGATTSRAVRDAGLLVAAEADAPTPEALARAIAAALG